MVGWRLRKLFVDDLNWGVMPWTVNHQATVGFVLGGGVHYMGKPQQPWVFLLTMIILGCFGGITISGNTHIIGNLMWQDMAVEFVPIFTCKFIHLQSGCGNSRQPSTSTQPWVSRVPPSTPIGFMLEILPLHRAIQTSPLYEQWFTLPKN